MTNGAPVVFRGDFVVCTTSVGVLKRGLLNFNPPYQIGNLKVLIKLKWQIMSRFLLNSRNLGGTVKHTSISTSHPTEKVPILNGSIFTLAMSMDSLWVSVLLLAMRLDVSKEQIKRQSLEKFIINWKLVMETDLVMMFWDQLTFMSPNGTQTQDSLVHTQP